MRKAAYQDRTGSFQRISLIYLVISIVFAGTFAGCMVGSPMYVARYEPLVDLRFRFVGVTCWPTYREVKSDLSMWVINRSPDTLFVDLMGFRAASISQVDREHKFRPYSTSASSTHCLEYRGEDDEADLCRVGSRSFDGINERFDLGMEADTSSSIAPQDSIDAARFFPVAPGTTERVDHGMGFRYGRAVRYGTRAPDLLDRDECMERFSIRRDTLLVTTPPVLKDGKPVIPSRQIRFIYVEDDY